ncbi:MULTISPECIES: hypothetical protein [Micrococcaceae]|uniref:hypothetical protein n=1 Tax=Micrococcaceae TaxID=1268 RepID=UPI001FB28EA4|nr:MULTISPECIES: hypothetical protein [Paenarthrobacter]MCW3767265.1 hypothetical protein [Paenarthrobacter sp. PAE-2]UOD83441.1 hypothetical protein MQZ73_20135 [Paenarthrobacter ureafaciens]WOC63314.1 hypothetical protein RI444_22490 [Paenarthrobacter sp. AT5]
MAEWFSVAIAALSLVVAGLAWISSRKANDIARGANARADHANAIAESALEDARRARLDIVWDEAIRALNDLVTFDFAGSSEAVGPKLVSARTSLQMLADKLDGDAVGKWLQADWATANLFMREALEKKVDKRRADYVEAVLEANSTAAAWLVGMINNIRFARLGGVSEDVIERLQRNAVEHAEDIRKRNNWPEDSWLPETLQPLQDDRTL